MTNEAIQQELAELRAQLYALKSEREATLAAEDNENAGDESTAGEFTGLHQNGGWDLGDYIRSLKEHIDESLKDSNPTALLLVFALGVLVGRTLSK